jgi:hypothetical protein
MYFRHGKKTKELRVRVSKLQKRVKIFKCKEWSGDGASRCALILASVIQETIFLLDKTRPPQVRRGSMAKGNFRNKSPQNPTQENLLDPKA